jgi:hypothetical protein
MNEFNFSRVDTGMIWTAVREYFGRNYGYGWRRAYGIKSAGHPIASRR